MSEIIRKIMREDARKAEAANQRDATDLARLKPIFEDTVGIIRREIGSLESFYLKARLFGGSEEITEKLHLRIYESPTLDRTSAELSVGGRVDRGQ